MWVTERGGQVLVNRIEEWAARGFDERQPFAVPSTGIAKKHFRLSVVLACERQARRTAHPPRGQQHGDSGSEEQQRSRPGEPGTANGLRMVSHMPTVKLAVCV